MRLFNKTTLSCLVFCTVSATMLAQGNLSAPYSVVDGKVALSYFQSLDNPKTAEGIFLNALYYIKDGQKRDEEGNLPATSVDYDTYQFTTELAINSSQTNSVYRYVLSVKVAENIITLLLTDITCESEVAVVKLTKRLAFEKLQPEKKSKHKEYSEDFAKLAQQSVDKLLEFVSEQTPPTVTHYKEIKSGQVAKGMTEAECLFAMGKPVSVNTNGSKTQWIYGAFTHVFFEEGVVATFIR